MNARDPEHFVPIVLAAVLALGLIAGGCTRSEPPSSPGPMAQRMDDSDSNRPQRVGGESDWISVLPEFQHTCGLRKGGSLWCWGGNYAGQLGDGTKENRAVPVRVGTVDGWTEIALGDHHTCARRGAGEVWCWGAHVNGHPASRDDVGNLLPERMDLHFGADQNHETKLARLEVGDGATCALTEAGTVYCWGRGDRLGASVLLNAHEPKALALPASTTGSRIRDIAIGSHHGCALTESGRVLCWGSNAYGQLGSGESLAVAFSPVPLDTTTLPPGARFQRLFAGTYHACGFLTDGSLWCWGKGTEGQLGDGGTENRRRPVRVDVSPLPEGRRFVDVDGGFSHTCALDDAGQPWCWGAGPRGSADPTVPAPRPEPVDMTRVPSGRFAFLATGVSHSCAIDVEGGLYCWGDDSNGKLGLGRE